MSSSDLMTLSTFIVAFFAFMVALITAIIQIKVHVQELRPFLSFSGTKNIIKIFIETGRAGIDFVLILKNVGKCVLYYEIVQFDIFVNGVKLPDVDVRNKGSVIGVNTEVAYSKFFEEILQYEKGLMPEQYVLPNHKLIFLIEYHRANKPRKKYKLFYEVFIEFENGARREFYGKTLAD
jgi:hypothetical protein